jgi:PAS domain S-box-containing protein
MSAQPQPIEDNLAEVLKVFNESTMKLKGSYDALQAKFGELNRELENKNIELSRKVAEISEIKDYLNSVLQSVTDGVIAIDMQHRITAFNQAAERITGLAAKDVLGRRYDESFKTDFGVELDDDSDESGELSPYMLRDLEVIGRGAFPIRESTSLTRDSDGRINGAVKVIEDLTELRELEEQARRQDRLAALGQMAATVAHEIRNPLGGIEGFASLLSRDFEDDDPRLKLVMKVLEGTRSLNRVVSELLMFTRPIRLDFRRIEIASAVEAAIGSVSENIESSNIEMRKKLGTAPLYVLGDGEQLKRALLNIILNAVQAMPKGGELEIACQSRSLPEEARQLLGKDRNGTWVDVEIRDSGPGIEESEIPRIFNPFYTKKEKGTGLGLAIATKIIEAHRGQIMASNSSGGGAVFTISLPMDTQG